MKKFLVYGLATLIIGGVGVNFNSWEDKGEVKVKEFNIPPKVNKEVLESDKTPNVIPVKNGEILEINMQNAKINFKYYDGDKVLISSSEDTWVIAKNEKGISIIEDTDAYIDKKFDYVTITVPKNANFNLDIKTNDSKIFGEISQVNNLHIDTDKGFVDIKLNKVNNIDIQTGYGNIDLAIEEITGQITGRVGVGSINFDIENENKINLNGYKIVEDKIFRVDENNKGNQSVSIKGDLGKVIFK